MESTFVSTNPTASLFPIAKSINPNSRTPVVSSFGTPKQFGSVHLSRGNYRIECLGSSPVPLASGGGGSVRKDAYGDGDGDGDGDASSGGAVLDDVSTFSSDVILLQVGGMTCGGCAASVKRILESQPQVSSANVDLTTEVAIVWPSSDAKDGPNWQVQLGEALANHLTNCGFKSKLKDQGSNEGGSSF